VPIEERSGDEVTHVRGRRVAPIGAQARNPAFDVTPARLVSGLITERGICAASEHGLIGLFGDAR